MLFDLPKLSFDPPLVDNTTTTENGTEMIYEAFLEKTDQQGVYESLPKEFGTLE